MEDLWPDDIKAVTKIKAPVAILREQAALLGNKTDNIVTAEVSSYEPSGLKANQFYYVFYMEAPVLGGYRYNLFTISHDIELYPVYFTVEESIMKKASDGEAIKANSEEEFIGILKKIFDSDKTKGVIGAIFTQSSTG